MAALKIGFVIEQTLGQVTHTQNLKSWVGQDPEVDPTWFLISYEATGGLAGAPLIRNNWTLRASLDALSRVRDHLKRQRLDGLFFHTPVTALMAHRLMNEVPSVVSMDATARNIDSIGDPYNHRPQAAVIERVKHVLTRRTFTRARKLVVWNEWARTSLIQDYNLASDKVSVIPPGIDLARWRVRRKSASPGDMVRLLFVGGDFRRKGGLTLLEAFRSALVNQCELDIVTRENVDISGLTGVRVHKGLKPNSAELMALYAQADVFVFPTTADVLPLAIMEAMACGLPVITTNVGAIREEIDDGVTGILVPVHCARPLAEATLRLIEDRALRTRMAEASLKRARERFDGATNYSRLLSVCKACAAIQ